MLYKHYFVVLLSLWGLAACESAEQEREQLTRETALAYFETYQQREDWDSLLSFYRDDVQFKDANLSYETQGIEAFKEFYNWPDTSFRKIVDEQQHLVLETMMVEDSIVVGSGRLNPFFWNNELQEWPDSFTIWLYFDKNMKIYKQIDWVRYPAWMIQSFEQ